VTGLALIQKVLRIETDLWVVAVLIVQPYPVVYYQPRLLATDLTEPTILSYALIDEGLPGPAPCLCLVELFLGHIWPPMLWGEKEDQTHPILLSALRGVTPEHQKETKLFAWSLILPIYQLFTAMHCQVSKTSKKSALFDRWNKWNKRNNDFYITLYLPYNSIYPLYISPILLFSFFIVPLVPLVPLYKNRYYFRLFILINMVFWYIFITF
jgi:hypothetical protein